MHVDYSLLSTEIALAVLGLIVFTLGLTLPSKSTHRGLGAFTIFGLLIILGITVLSWGTQAELLTGMYLIDNFTIFFKILALVAAILIVFGTMKYVNCNLGQQLEYYSIIVFATLGMIIMISAGDFITLYIGLELMTVSFIILVAFRKTDGYSLEAGIKYLILAGLSSAVLLYGLSLVYGATGTVYILELAELVTAGSISPMLVFGLVLLVAGFAFKISAAPFHMWAPDVYEGAPTPVTAYLAVGSKAASFAILVRVFVGGLVGMHEQWANLLAVLAAISILLGNLVAIPQTNIKRMLAYSSIAQAGYILVGLLTASPEGVKAIMFYAFIYLFATIGAFVVVCAVYEKTKSDEIASYAGLSQRAPLAAAVMLVSLLSMAGIPPLAGFVGKFYLFTTITDSFMWLVYIGLIMSMVSVYYYLRVALVMYRDEPTDPTPIKMGVAVNVTLIIAMVATIVLGVYPAPLSELSNIAAQSFFSW